MSMSKAVNRCMVESLHRHNAGRARSVLECASPLALLNGRMTAQSHETIEFPVVSSYALSVNGLNQKFYQL